MAFASNPRNRDGKARDTLVLIDRFLVEGPTRLAHCGIRPGTESPVNKIQQLSTHYNNPPHLTTIYGRFRRVSASQPR